MGDLRRILGLSGLVAGAAVASASINIVATNTPFLDIQGTGTSVGAISDDSESVITGAALNGAGFAGNGLLAGGVSVRVGNNGAVIWGNSATDTFANATEVGYINSPAFGSMAASNLTDRGNGGSGPRQFLAPLWDDNFPGTGATTRWQVIAGNLYVQWTNQDHFNAQGNGTITYQMIVYGGVSIGSGQKLVEFVYQDTLYDAQRYQNDGGSATIGYKNWGINPNANDVEWGIGGGTDSLGDPAFGGTNMQPKVAGWAAGENQGLTHSVAIVPEPTSLALIALGGLATALRRRG